MAKGLKNPWECSNIVCWLIHSKKNWKTSSHTSICAWICKPITTWVYIYDALSDAAKQGCCFKKGFGMCVASVQTNITSPNALITPSSLTHACSTSAESELCLFTSVPVGQVCSKKPWTTSTDTHSLGSLSCPPIKAVYHRLPDDVIPSPSAKLITTL